jgi:aspartate aminotransferase-like enzyme
LNEGLNDSFARHERVAVFCRKKLNEMGLSLFPALDAEPSPTVTAVKMPRGFTWPEFDATLRQHGLVVGGSFGPLAGKVFRLGHMGTQADMELVEQALGIIEKVIA